MIHPNAVECKEKGGTSWMTPALSSENRLRSALLGLDEFDHVANGGELFGFFVGHFDFELFLKGHHQLDGVERIGSEILDELRLGVDLIGVHAELIDDDIFDAFFDGFVGHGMWLVAGVALGDGYGGGTVLGNPEKWKN